MAKRIPDTRELIPGHHSFPRVEADNIPVVGPIYQSAKFTFSCLADLEKALAGEKQGYWYQRRNNPTVRELEETVASLQGQEDAIVTASGIAAIILPLIALLQSDDHAIFFLESYKNSRVIPKMLLSRFRIRSTFLSIHDHAAIEEVACREKTKLIFFESITHPMNRIPDVDAIVSIAKKVGAYTVLDNTSAGLHQMTNAPVDLFIHSLTKFANGHGDVMGGAVIGGKKLLKKIKDYNSLLGATIDPHTAFLILRGLKTYFIRFKAQNDTAAKLAETLEVHPSIEMVMYPGLSSHPEHALAKKQLEHFGALITFDLKEGKNLRAFVDSLSLFHLTFSLGATESMVAPIKIFYASDLSQDQQRDLKITERTVRLSIGLEPFEALRDDIYRSLENS